MILLQSSFDGSLLVFKKTNATTEPLDIFKPNHAHIILG